MSGNDLIRLSLAASMLDRSERTLRAWHDAGQAPDGQPFHLESQDVWTRRVYVRRSIVERIAAKRLRRMDRRQ